MDGKDSKVLKVLAREYRSSAAAATEIINLQSIMNLPKGTEHFLTDIHGEYEQFNHVLKNGSGFVRKKIDEEFGNTISNKDKKSLATLIYYPEEKLEIVEREEENLEDWYKISLHRLVQMIKRVSSKYTRSKVRKALPGDFAYVIEELITEKAEIHDKEAYYNEIIHTIIRIGRAPQFIIALSQLIQCLVIDHLHIVGDIYDRGPGPHIIMDTLCAYHSVDVQWGNHDIVWMGAAGGHLACIANVVRMAAHYGNLATLEDGYGINLLPLATFAMETYQNVDCSAFSIRFNTDYNTKDLSLDTRMHKAIAVMQFKLEGQLLMRHPEFRMEDRMLLDRIDFDRGTVRMEDMAGNSVEYTMLDMGFPTIDPQDPYALTEEESKVMERLRQAFVKCEKLQRHVRFLYAKGGLYKIYNGNLLYHGCVPMNGDGSFMEVDICGKRYYGKALYDILEYYARRGYYAKEPAERALGQDIMWFIWSGKGSPVFGKEKMATFERYFIAEKETHEEKKNSYYRLLEKEETVDRILGEFGLHSREAHIVNGHVPVEQIHGESPVKCGGRLLIIDGGFSKAYQKKTGIAGYTLVCNSRGMSLAAHEPFESAGAVIEKESDLFSHWVEVESFPRRKLVSDTDVGQEIRERIYYLEELLEAYRDGTLMEEE
ncbi:fructose-1,6-bisphosphatase [Acetatifactor muris]|jgi:fructose-1,6-bisphosphatase-3|uniref:Fructose-1,6-bisphosphatase class 3 n=1 Tax=Acetatifactor muris TaxID=879566 RepID=A0A2K4ZM69_9FIRM|nr:fructose-1,6-bisphosphatase [Acetatifactor muris]MCI8798633.1 fructose-1,6-bisphosphatase [Lachnospiraceae bacterium]MCR2049819.1 fructose-1,6-bisphosphatase [Acetatifactor muris]SOY31584.1 Fructose-1,6-bisphosphatase class 3 [Acetatifactor muris]